MRLIDADAFIQMMEEKCDPESTLDPWVLSVCRGGVKMMPTVDAVPVRHGRWEWDGEAFVCSACGSGYEGQPTMMGKPMFEFCPVCGADMRKDGDHAEGSV